MVKRRKFLEGLLAAALAAIGCNTVKKEVHPPSHTHPEALSHPFFQDPLRWLEAHAADLERSFDLSTGPVEEVEELCVDEGIVPESQPGKRIFRTPGCGILLSEESYLSQRTHELKALGAKDLDGTPRYTLKSHAHCGACAAYAKKQRIEGESDTLGKEELTQRIGRLREQGIDASFGGNIEARDMDRPEDLHPACLCTIDCTGGRLHDPRLSGLPQSFVVSSLDPKEAGSALELIVGISSGDHGYGDALKEFTVLVFLDPSDHRRSEGILRAIEEAAEKVTTKGKVRVKVLSWDAPLH